MGKGKTGYVHPKDTERRRVCLCKVDELKFDDDIYMISNKFLPLKAAASRPGFGFSPSQAGPKPSWSRHFGPAWLTASGRAMHIPKHEIRPVDKKVKLVE